MIDKENIISENYGRNSYPVIDKIKDAISNPNEKKSLAEIYGFDEEINTVDPVIDGKINPNHNIIGKLEYLEELDSSLFEAELEYTSGDLEAISKGENKFSYGEEKALEDLKRHECNAHIRSLREGFDNLEKQTDEYNKWAYNIWMKGNWFAPLRLLRLQLCMPIYIRDFYKWLDKSTKTRNIHHCFSRIRYSI